MSLIGFCNIGSLIMGLAAWIIAIISIVSKSQQKKYARSIASFSCCGIALVLQFLELRTNVTIGNLTAIMDTIQVTFGAAAILVMITIVLNLIAYKHTKP